MMNEQSKMNKNISIHKVVKNELNLRLNEKKSERHVKKGIFGKDSKLVGIENPALKILQRKPKSDDKIDPGFVFFIVLIVIFLISYLYFSNFHFV